jgi:hypothetical protein
MKIVFQVVVGGMIAALCACSGKNDAPVPVAPPVAALGEKTQVPRNIGHRMILEPVGADKFTDGPKQKNGEGSGGNSSGGGK